MRSFQKQFQGVIFLALSALCFMLPAYLKRTGEAHHRVIVATAEMPADQKYSNKVVLVLNHNGFKAVGVQVNTPDVGGDKAPDETVTIHSTDVMSENSEDIPGLSLATTQDKGFADAVRNGTKKPKYHLTVNGYAHWGVQELSAEIAKGWWKVVEYDPALVFETPVDKMHAAALAARPVFESRSGK
jgi:putative AlgH/UPF0301 family transcriptional regulator